MLHPSVPYRRGATSGGSWSSRSNIGYTLQFPIDAGRRLEVLDDYISVGVLGVSLAPVMLRLPRRVCFWR